MTSTSTPCTGNAAFSELKAGSWVPKVVSPVSAFPVSPVDHVWGADRFDSDTNLFSS